MEVLYVKIIASLIALLSVSGEGNVKLPPIGIYIPPGYPMVLLNPLTVPQGHGEKGMKPTLLHAGGVSFHPIALEPIHLEPIHLQPITIGGKQYTAELPKKDLPQMEGNKGSENAKGTPTSKSPGNGNSRVTAKGKPDTGNQQQSVRPPTNGNDKPAKGNQGSSGAEEKNHIGSSTGNYGAASVGKGTHTVGGGRLGVTGVGSSVAVEKGSSGPGSNGKGVIVNAAGINTGPVSSTAISTDGGPAVSNSVAISMSAGNIKHQRPNSSGKDERPNPNLKDERQNTNQDGQNQNQGAQNQNQGTQNTNQGDQSPKQEVQNTKQDVQNPKQDVQNPKQDVQNPKQEEK